MFFCTAMRFQVQRFHSLKVLFFVQLQTRVSVKMTLYKKSQDHIFSVRLCAGHRNTILPNKKKTF